jgi:hypothetical protein
MRSQNPARRIVCPYCGHGTRFSLLVADLHTEHFQQAAAGKRVRFRRYLNRRRFRINVALTCDSCAETFPVPNTFAGKLKPTARIIRSAGATDRV